MEEHAVIVSFRYAADSLAPLHDLEKRLRAAVADVGVGELDGNDVAPDLSDGTLYLYGPDADALFAVARSLLAAAECLRAAHATLQYGPPEDGVPEREVSLNAGPNVAPESGHS